MSEEIVHIISRGNKWALKKSGGKRAISIHKFREQAFHEAMLISSNVVVHNKDASVLFTVGENK